MIDYLAFTGHRPDKLGGYTHAATRRLVCLARDVIIETPCHCVITGMALGWDQAVAQACVELWHPFIAAIPFEGQERIWPIDSRLRYRELLKAASRVEICSDSKVPIGAAMQIRNQWMVDECNKLGALWNGSPGGTANCVRYAEKQGRPIVHLWDRYEANLPADLWNLLS